MNDERFSSGYFLISRYIIDSSLWSLSPECFRVAVYLLLMARHSDKNKRLPDGTIIGRGELVTSMAHIAENCEYYDNRLPRKYSRKKVLNILEKLESIGFLVRNSHSKGTHVTICNYGDYQNPKNYNSHNVETVVEQQGNSKGTVRDTNNKGNNENNGNKTTLVDFACSLIDDDERIGLVREWFKYKSEIKKPLKSELGVKRMVGEWSKYSNDQIREVMSYSMSNNYQGMIWDKLGQNPSQQAPHIKTTHSNNPDDWMLK